MVWPIDLCLMQAAKVLEKACMKRPQSLVIEIDNEDA